MGNAGQRFAFAGYRLDVSFRRLWAPDGSALPLTGKAFDVLVHLVRNAGDVVDKEDLLAEVWRGRVVEENNLTQAVSALRRAFGTGAGDRRFIVTVSGRGYSFVAPLEPAEGADWDVPGAPAHAPAGADDPPAIATGESLRGTRGWRLVLLLVLLVGVVGITALRQWHRPALQEGSEPPATLAVLPFRQIGAGPDDAMLALGLADTLITHLSQTTNLRVLALASTQASAGEASDPLRAGMALGADYVVDGSTQRVGNAIRVNARLMSMPDGRTVWAGTFDQAPERIFTLQDAIAEGMSSVISLKYSSAARHASACDGSDAHAYRDYLSGRDMMNHPDRDHLVAAVAAFRRAIERDPRCARAWAGIAFAYRAQVMTADGDPRVLFPKAGAAVANALALDPNSAEAHASKGFIEYWYEWDWAAAEASFRRAITLNPNSPETYLGIANLLGDTGRSDEALPYARKAILLDPMSPMVNTIMAGVLATRDNQAQTRQRIDRVLELNPDFWVALMLRGMDKLRSGDKAAGMRDLAHADRACEGCSHVRAVQAAVRVWNGDRAGAEAILAELEQRARDGYSPATRRALVNLALGNRERALDLLDEGYRQRDASMAFLIVDGRWRVLDDEPRFRALLTQLDLHLPERKADAGGVVDEVAEGGA